jgi:hypothetical protein
VVAIGLQEKESFLPVGNRFGNHTDREMQNSGFKGNREEHTRNTETKESWKGGSLIMGYIPIQIINLSLE